MAANVDLKDEVVIEASEHLAKLKEQLVVKDHPLFARVCGSMPDLEESRRRRQTCICRAFELTQCKGCFALCSGKVAI